MEPISFDLGHQAEPQVGETYEAAWHPDELRERYSSATLDKARRAEASPQGTTGRAFRVISLTSPGSYLVRPVQDVATGEILGCSCTCPNGRNRARAECYHAAAVELWMGEHS